MSGWNLPPGVTPGDVDMWFGEVQTCSGCGSFLEFQGCGVCLKALRDAYDDRAIDGDGWGIVADAAAWMADHVVDGGEAECGRYDG